MKAKLYNTYLFRTKDPVIDSLRTVVQNSKKSYNKISDDSNVSDTTLRGWFDGKTKRPQFATVVAVGRALGPDGIRAITRVIERGR